MISGIAFLIAALELTFCIVQRYNPFDLNSYQIIAAQQFRLYRLACRL